MRATGVSAYGWNLFGEVWVKFENLIKKVVLSDVVFSNIADYKLYNISVNQASFSCF